MSLYTISAIHILMDEFTMDDNLYHPWQHIRPMNVFDHRPKVLSFPIRYHLIILMLGGQGISKMSIFPLWIWYFSESAWKSSQDTGAVFVSSNDAILRRIAGLNILHQYLGRIWSFVFELEILWSIGVK